MELTEITIPTNICALMSSEVDFSDQDALQAYLGKLQDTLSDTVTLLEEGVDHERAVAMAAAPGIALEIARWVGTIGKEQGANVIFVMPERSASETSVPMISRPPQVAVPPVAPPPNVTNAPPKVASGVAPVSQPSQPSTLITRAIDRAARSTMFYDQDAGAPAKRVVDFDPNVSVEQQNVSPLATHFPEWDLMPKGGMIQRSGRTTT